MRQGLEPVPDYLAQAVQDIGGHVRAEAGAVAAADGQDAGPVAGADGDQGRRLHPDPKVGEQEPRLLGVQGTAQTMPAVGEVAEGRQERVRRRPALGALGFPIRDGKELERDALGIELAAQGLVQYRLDPRLIRGDDQGQGEAVEAV
jgi:hypothetical protein